MNRVLEPSVAGVAPFGALLLAVAGGSAALEGAEATGFLWSIAGACVLLAVCCMGIVRAHGPTPPTRVQMGGWGSAFGFVAIGMAFVAMALGEAVAADPEPPIAAMPALLAGSGIVTLPIANGMLALGTGGADRLPPWGTAALWVVTPLTPLVLVTGGATDSAVVPLLVLVLLALGWVAVGLALRASDR